MKHRRVYLQEVRLLITVPQVLEPINEKLGLLVIELTLEHLGQDFVSLFHIQTTSLVEDVVCSGELQRVIQLTTIPCHLIYQASSWSECACL